LESWDFHTVADELSDHHAVTTIIAMGGEEE